MISKSPKSLSGSDSPTILRLRFQITQSRRDAKLMRSFIQYFGCGNYYSYSKDGCGNFMVQKLSDITEKIIPFYKKNPILGVKSLDFEN